MTESGRVLMEHVSHQGEVKMSLCSMVHLHNISKPRFYSTHILCFCFNDSQFCFGICFLL